MKIRKEELLSYCLLFACLLSSCAKDENQVITSKIALKALDLQMDGGQFIAGDNAAHTGIGLQPVLSTALYRDGRPPDERIDLEEAIL